MSNVPALILAAGFGTRFGSDKRRATLADGRTLLAASLERARTVFDEVQVVLRPEDDPTVLGLPEGCNIILCEDAGRGMGHSLAAGARALANGEADAIAVLLGDMPWIAESSLRALLGKAAPGRIVFPVHHDERGHPVLFGREFWPELCALTGDEGARRVLRAHAAAWVAVGVDDPGVLRDVDSPEALLP
ncbi:nucleotidyltransferase family protein [Pseudomonas sp. JS3066]|jgi:molybdenum cofactor cytidylyltransferase|uniref:nucleotidyltransferase family protein n=1 Tax=unclassified Pseudomonas TaxID=196821 RepID=UPI000EA912F8|nr:MULTISPECIES: nucleotidyltransferase family protein [unclassified Pseudomonas]AYF88478.1 nucleotidyltransferase family protein [Pseudomonas sp. DY-1]WVK93984.1 nucleotidyltransferase family protein [Pseudomonas sp. JS3066]